MYNIAVQARDHSRLRRLLLTVTAACTAALVFALPQSVAGAQETYTLYFTAGIGAYAQSEPRLGTPIGAAVAEGTSITVTCWSRGGDVTNPDGYTSDIWMRDPAGGYWSEAWLYTGSYGAPAGIAQCKASDKKSATPKASAAESPVKYSGDTNLNYWSRSPFPMGYALFDHYLWGEGRAVVLDPDRVAATRGFRAKVKSLTIDENASALWTPPRDSDLFYAVGTFTLTRTSENCWALYDFYDFRVDYTKAKSPEDWAKVMADSLHFPYWAYELGGAAPFDVYSSGCLTSEAGGGGGW